MAHKQFKKIKDLSKDELLSQARTLEASIFQDRMKLRTGQLENTSLIWAKRKELARVKTVLTASMKTQEVKNG